MLEVNKIHNMNCLEGMKMMDDCSVDLIVTDPPYKTITGGRNNGKNHKRPKGVLHQNNGLFKHQTDIKTDDWIGELFRVLKEGSQCYIFTNTINLEEMLTKAREVGFQLHNVLVWEKNNCTPSQWYMKNCEYVLFLRKGKAKWINNIGDSKTVHKFNNIVGKKLHPTQKPVDLLKFYIENSSKEGDLVFDPFMGSGSTAVAAKELKRDYLGFELDDIFMEIIYNRVN